MNSFPDARINKNILKKEFEQRTNYIKVSRGEIDFNEILNFRNSRNFNTGKEEK